MLRYLSVFGDTLPVCLWGAGDHFIFPISAVRACLADLSRVFIFKAAWFALTLCVSSFDASAFYDFIFLTDPAGKAGRQDVGTAGVVFTIYASFARAILLGQVLACWTFQWTLLQPL